MTSLNLKSYSSGLNNSSKPLLGTMAKHYKIRRKQNMISLLKDRELQEKSWRAFHRHAQVSPSMVDHLGLSAELEGHCGCVNCIEFNESGNLLLSGSDDFTIVLWDVYHRKKLKSLTTGHRGNIFSVKFLPERGDKVIASAAGDCRLELRDLESGDTIQVCKCHSERIKRIATVPSDPNLIFTASEDGTVLLLDTRLKHQCDSNPSNVFLNLKKNSGKTIECKCVIVHPLRSELVAVGASDPYIRVFDRRMIKTARHYSSNIQGLSPNNRTNFNESLADEVRDNLSPECVQYFVPGHLPSKMRQYMRRCRSLSTTYLSYSSDGKYLLANLGGDHIYLFDTLEPNIPTSFTMPERNTAQPHDYNMDAMYDAKYPSKFLNRKDPPSLPSCSEKLWKEAQKASAEKQYTTAIQIFNTLLQRHPTHSNLYSGRAGVLIERKWDGDNYAALRDCNLALVLDNNNWEAKNRRLPCLHLLGLELGEENQEADSDSRLYESNLRYEQNSSNHSNGSDSEREDEIGLIPVTTEMEKKWRSLARDYDKVYSGHCNTTTDIKEAVFIGKGGKYIAAGSDDGNLFIWDRYTANLVNVIKADNSIVNCVQSHPNICMLASSGIESAVKLWSPLPQEDEESEKTFTKHQINKITEDNQQRMCSDPVETMILQMGDFVQGWVQINDNSSDAQQNQNRMQCRTN